MPKVGIQSVASVNWKPAGPKAKAANNRSEKTQARSAKASAVRRIRSASFDGRTAISSAPTRGVRMIRLKTGIVLPPPDQDQEIADDHGNQADGDAESVVLDPARLDVAQSRARAGGRGADAVDRAVDDRPVEPERGVGELGAPDHEQQVVEVVEPPFV